MQRYSTQFTWFHGRVREEELPGPLPALSAVTQVLGSVEPTELYLALAAKANHPATYGGSPGWCPHHHVVSHLIVDGSKTTFLLRRAGFLACTSRIGGSRLLRFVEERPPDLAVPPVPPSSTKRDCPPSRQVAELSNAVTFPPCRGLHRLSKPLPGLSIRATG